MEKNVFKMFFGTCFTYRQKKRPKIKKSWKKESARTHPKVTSDGAGLWTCRNRWKSWYSKQVFWEIVKKEQRDSQSEFGFYKIFMFCEEHVRFLTKHFQCFLVFIFICLLRCWKILQNWASSTKKVILWRDLRVRTSYLSQMNLRHESSCGEICE